MIESLETTCLGFSAVRLRNDRLELTLVPELGGRIMGFGAHGGNLLFVNDALAGWKPEYEPVHTPEEMQRLREEGPLMLYGGEKTWLAPQSDWGSRPYTDLDHGSYSMDLQYGSDHLEVVLTSPVCRETKLQLRRRIRIPNKGGGIEIRQELHNHGTEPAQKGLWQVTMLKRPALAAIKAGRSGEGWKDYYEADNLPISREQGQWFVFLHDSVKFKAGLWTDQKQLTMEFKRDRDTYLLTQSSPNSEHGATAAGDFPHGVRYEFYNSDQYPYFEAEIHSPSYCVLPLDSVQFTVYWDLLHLNSFQLTQ